MYLDIKHSIQAEKVWIENRYICLKLSNDEELRFPAAKNKKLSAASEKELKNVELICDGTGLHWEDIDEDLSINGIIDGRYG